MDLVSDALPSDRKKVTHPRGVTFKAQMISVEGHPFTGLFKGADYCVMRISDTTRTTPKVINTKPGHGFKCLVDGHPSGNVLAMHSFDGQCSYNFFKNRYLTHIAPGEFEYAV